MLYTASMIDRFEVADALGDTDHVAVERHRMLLPIVKTWCAESGWRVLGQESLQVFGGSGYLRDYPLEQYVRDTKIDAIYEGTTGIQSLDLFERRLVRDQGATAELLLAEIAQTVDELATSDLATESVLLGDALAAFRGMLENAFAQAADAPRTAALGLTRLLMSMATSSSAGCSCVPQRPRWPASTTPACSRRPTQTSWGAWQRDVGSLGRCSPTSRRSWLPRGCWTTNRWPCPTRPCEHTTARYAVPHHWRYAARPCGQVSPAACRVASRRARARSPGSASTGHGRTTPRAVGRR